MSFWLERRTRFVFLKVQRIETVRAPVDLLCMLSNEQLPSSKNHVVKEAKSVGLAVSENQKLNITRPGPSQHIARIDGNLFIGDYQAISSESVLTEYNIRHILTVCQSRPV